jgi:trk system potassium uptake protein TrkH
MAAMGPPVLFITVIMMFIGASPGSTGGGIKTCTLAVLIASSRAIMRGREEVRLMKRSVESKTVAEAICVTFFAACLVMLVCTLLMVTEGKLVTDTPEKGHLMHFLFETVSAFGTVGLSTGVTPVLTVWGKLLIVMTMFAGRVGPLTLALIIMRRERAPAVHFPEEDIMIG